MQSLRSHRSAFTLIELLVVIAIIAILAVVVILTLNPAELLRQSRDSSRLSDMATLNSALGLYAEDQGSASNYSLGAASTTYISIPDPSATSTAGDQCQGLGLPTLPTGDTYQCAGSSTNRNINNTGWIPVNFKNISSGSPIGNLPIDPTNTSSSNLYYTYTTDGTRYEVTSLVESTKYRTQFGSTYPIQDYPGVDAQGSSLSLSELYSPTGLIAYFPLNEGSGTIAYDSSGNGNNGVWNGTPSGLNSTYYTGGKVGAYSGSFNGSNDYINLGSGTPFNQQSITFSSWVDPSTVTGDLEIMAKELQYKYRILNGAFAYLISCDGSSWSDSTAVATSVINPVANTWYDTVLTVNSPSNTVAFYINGQLVNSSTLGCTSISSFNGNPMQIGAYNGSGEFSGVIDDARIYNRALSPSEVQGIYNAEH